MKIEPYVLIGGASTRFGRDKATYVFKNERLADRAARIAESALKSGPAFFVTSERAPDFSSKEGSRVIKDVVPGRGAVGAVHTALVNAVSPWIFVLACDLAFLTTEFVSVLQSRIDNEMEAVVPVQSDGRWQPLCAFYRVGPCRQVFERAVRFGGKVSSLREITASLNVCLVGSDEIRAKFDEMVLKNVNRPEDLPMIQ